MSATNKICACGKVAKHKYSGSNICDSCHAIRIARKDRGGAERKKKRVHKYHDPNAFGEVV